MPRFISLFSGCGGFDLGFVNAGFKCVAAFDHKRRFLQVHSENIDTGTLICCNLARDGVRWSNMEGVDVVVAGPPCQGFSTLGKSERNDPRNSLLVRAGMVASLVRPKVFVLENVSGVKAGKHEAFLQRLYSLLESAGFEVKEIACRADNHGVPQRRKRILVVAWRTNGNPPDELPTMAGGTLGAVLRNVEGVPDHCPKRLEEGSIPAEVAKEIDPGQRLSNVRGGDRSVHTWDIPEVYGDVGSREKKLLNAMRVHRRRRRVRDWGDADPLPLEYLEDRLGEWVEGSLRQLMDKGYVRKKGDHFDLTRTFNGKFRRPRPSEPAPTVNTRFGDPWYFLHPFEDRAFTVREAARIQGFPDSFHFSGSRADKFTMIGNAVPPPLGEVVARYVKDHLIA